MALAALIVAIIAAVTGIAVLAWEVVSFRASGRKLRVLAGYYGGTLAHVHVEVINVGRRACSGRST